MSATPGGYPVVIAAAAAGTPVAGQITVAATATLIKSANVNRTAIIVVNHGTTNVFLSFTNTPPVTVTTGVMLAGIPGQSLTFQSRSDIYGIAASGTQVVGFYEELR